MNGMTKILVPQVQNSSVHKVSRSTSDSITTDSFTPHNNSKKERS